MRRAFEASWICMDSKLNVIWGLEKHMAPLQARVGYRISNSEAKTARVPFLVLPHSHAEKSSYAIQKQFFSVRHRLIYIINRYKIWDLST